MIETDRLPEHWLPRIEAFDEVWVPTKHVEAACRHSGTPPEKICVVPGCADTAIFRPDGPTLDLPEAFHARFVFLSIFDWVQVIPWGVDPDVFAPDVPPLLLPTPKTFRFLYVGGMIARKGFDRLWEAYLAEFSPDEDVCLVIKDMGADSFYARGSYRQQILATCNDPENPAIVHLDRHLTAGQLASLYTACDGLAAPYRGEGFGLPILEAMACGLPAIVPRGGASDDFVSEATGYLLPSQEVEVPMDLPLCGPALERSVEQADLRAVLRRVFEHRDDVRGKGHAAADHVRSSFCWSDTAKWMIDRIQALAASDRSGSTRDEIRAISGAPPVHVARSAICAVLSPS